MKSTLRFIAMIVCSSLAVRSGSLSASTFWEQDVWKDPDRPFLFYGSQKAPEKKETPKENGDRPLDSLKTMEELQTEVKARLNRAIMVPNEETLKSYLEINAFLMEKSATFAAVWRSTLIQNPAYDWTAAHPVANFASTTITREKDVAVKEYLKKVAPNWGLMMFTEKSRLTELMAPIVNRFAKTFGFELQGIAKAGAEEILLDSIPEKGMAQYFGVAIFPAVFLVKKGSKRREDAKLIATGVIDIAELTRRAAETIYQFEEKKEPIPNNKKEKGGDR